jgi:HD-GYP domain-containing protein (c-di-GMP phosphodiesterase class II)
VDNANYFKIRIHSLDPEAELTFDLFLLLNERYVLYMRAGDQIQKEKWESFKGKGSDVFYVNEKDRQFYKDYIHRRLNDDKMDPKKKAQILKESSFSLVEELFEQPDVSRALNDSKELISLFVNFIDQERDAVAHLIGLSSHDFYTYNHSLDVSIYALGLGQVAGYSGLKDLADMGQGALLHDIGKRHVPTEIICKKGGLDEAEWAQMKLHPTYGLQILSELPNVSDAIKACCFEHHENDIGNGYPQGLKSHEIHPMAGIVAITDTYDALTTKRSYNEPMTPTAALNLMKDKLAGRFNPDLLKAMYEVLFKMQKAG